MKRAIVVEDQKPIRESISEILKLIGFETRLIGDGHVALDALLAEPFDLITLDLNMPALDGLSLAETITNQDGPNRDTPIIVISAYLSPQTVELLQELGIRHFLPKPFEAEELLDYIEELSEKKSE